MEGFGGKVAAITGAGSGIGRALAVELARSGARLAISDFDADGLAQTEQLIQKVGADVRADRLDVTKRAAFLTSGDHSDRSASGGRRLHRTTVHLCC
jgi:NADP-dependent 3-hydroxy acid dehydrogenase YdfG